MTAPISACLIVRNEAPRLRDCLESIRAYVAEICIVDTGSSDGTQDIARAYTDRFVEDWSCNEGGAKDGPIDDFSVAREKSFSLASQPWILWIDGDDVLRGAEHLQEICERHASFEKCLFMFPYEYSHDHHGNVTCRHYRERLIKGRAHGAWKSPIHETWVPEPGFEVIQSDAVTWVHKRDAKHNVSARNLRILERWFTERNWETDDARMLYYIALEYGQNGNFRESIRFHEKYVEKSGWDDEKCLSMLDLSAHYQKIEEFEKAIHWGSRAMLLMEHWAEPRFALARSYYYLAQKGGHDAWRNWDRCANHITQGLALPPTVTPLFVNPLERRLDVHRYLTVAYSQRGRYQEALESTCAALQVAPDDPNLQFNQKRLCEILSQGKFEAALAELRSREAVSEEQVSLIRGIIAGKFHRHEQAAPERKSISAPSSTGLDIVIFTGAAFERWNPSTLLTGGMGGSETMAWEMARRLAQRGHRVRVFADAKDHEGTFEGVEWLHYQKFIDSEGQGPTCDVMISSRYAPIVDYPYRARATIAWVHDVHMGDALTHKRALKFDRFLCLSEWHKGFFLSTYPFIHPDSVLVTRNGIDLDRYTFEVPPERNPHRMIYSSSPDRGLQVALQCMPAIRARVPDATLHVYYGFDNWEKSPDQGQKNLAQALKGMIKAYEPFGVVYHGRVSGEWLAADQFRSGVWGYSTWFSETSCITAMEAQAAGIRIVTSPIAALNETVGNRGKMISGDWLSPEYAAKFTDAVVEAMLREGDDDRKALQAYARDHFSLDTLADEWSQMLARICTEVERDIVPKYKPVAA